MSGYYTNGGVTRGFRYTDGTGFEEIPSLGGAHSWASSIDSAGTVVGGAQVPNSPIEGYRRLGHAFTFDDPSGWSILNNYVDPASGLLLVDASDIVGDYIVGGAERDGVLRPFRMRRSTGVVEEIPVGWEGESWATGVNAFGDLVGYGYVDAAATQETGFVFSDRLGFKKMNNMIDPANNWNLEVPTEINDSGQFVRGGAA